MNLMTVDGYTARLEYNQERDDFRGEILGLNGSADFYGRSPRELRADGFAGVDGRNVFNGRKG